ncbi:DUF1189 family protein [Virgibacillus oceani]|uniref:DUF1189 domain-containing protein n=1 Tax=Virgibacillus oceani TaxID=1479511 RepID=A0A917M5M3_9BACI|nr:DUF1189 family protein [Virgibacillus oceani]GGG76444.1 hypothetical protein GCM10011398_21740 [Virgibacillus oceani]
MIFLQAFSESIKLPSKQAVFKLNRIGMDSTVVYMFILLFLVSIPSLIDRAAASNGPGADMNLFFLLVYFFIFYYLPLTIFVFVVLSAVAYVGTWISQLLHRKVRFALLWKMSAYTTTIPFIIYTVWAIVMPIDDNWLWLFLGYTFILLIKIITIYPKRKKRTGGDHH